MTDELDQILVLPSQLDYSEKLKKLREKKTPAGRFAGYDSKESRDVLEIIREVAEEGDGREFEDSDAAVRGFTKRFDDVDLMADEFRIAKKRFRESPTMKLTPNF